MIFCSGRNFIVFAKAARSIDPRTKVASSWEAQNK